MRNLKRALSLALASVMLLGMMVVGTSAASYPDVDENDNIEAIEVLNAVKVMIGEQGNFNPDSPVNRHQMAVIMAKLVLGNEIADKYVGTHPFTDVAPWADKYVAACYENGIVAGTSKTTFGGDQPLTAVQAAAFMLRALGYKDLSKGASDWSVPVTAMANQIRLFSGVASNPKEQLTRNQVARLALNTLKSPVVDLKDNTFTATDGDGKLIISGGNREYIVRSSSEAYAKAINSTEVAGTSASQISGYTIELGEHLYNGKLKLNTNAQDDFGRPSNNWQYDGKDIGTFVNYDLRVGEYKTGVTGAAMFELLTYTTINDNALLTYVDGVNSGITKSQLVRSNKNDLAYTDNGVLTEVFVDLDHKEVTITSINTYLAKANSDYNKANETLSLKVFASSWVGTTKPVDSKDVPQAADVAKDDYKLVYMSGRDNANSPTDYSRFTVVDMFDVEILTESTITKWSDATGTLPRKVVDKLTTGGSEYKSNPKAYFNDTNVLDYYNLQLLTDNTYNIYLDRYGNVIGVDLFEGTKNYVFITGYDRGQSHISVKTADAAAIFMDGTMKTITVNVTDTEKNITSAKSGNYDYDAYDTWNGSGDLDHNRWYTYTTASDGTYTLQPVKNFFYTSYNNDTTGADTIAAGTAVTLNSANLSLTDSRKTTGYTAKPRIYGNDDSVYITVEAGRVSETATSGAVEVNTPADGVKDAITGVVGVYTGAQNVKIDLLPIVKQEINTATGKNAYSGVANDNEKNAYVYSISDGNGYIIASIVMGEAQGASANYIYTLSKEKSEWVEKAGSSRANDSDTYFWEFDAVVNGEKTTLTVKSKWANAISTLKPFTVQEVRYDGDYVTKISDVTSTKAVYNNLDAANKFDKKDVYDVGHEHSSNGGWTWNSDNSTYTGFMDNTADTQGTRINGTIQLVGRTLYTERASGDVGLALATDAKAVLVQPENGKREVTNCASVDEAIGLLADADTRDIPAADGIQFRGRIVAVLDGNGVAKWVVIISDTNLRTGSDSGYDQGFQGQGVHVSLGETVTQVNALLAQGKDVTVDGSWLPADALVNQQLRVPAGRTLYIDGDFNTIQPLGGGGNVITTTVKAGGKIVVNGTFTADNTTAPVIAYNLTADKIELVSSAAAAATAFTLSGTITTTNNGDLNICGANNYVTVMSGTIKVTGDINGMAADKITSSAKTLNISGHVESNNVNVNSSGGAVTVTNVNTLKVTGTITAGTLNVGDTATGKSGAVSAGTLAVTTTTVKDGTLTVGTNNSAITVKKGTATVTTNAASGSVTVDATGAANTASASVTTNNGTVTATKGEATISDNKGTASTTASTGTLNITTVSSGTVTSTGGDIKIDTVTGGTVTGTGGNVEVGTVTGGTVTDAEVGTVTGGTIDSDEVANIGASANITIASGDTMTVTGDVASGATVVIEDGGTLTVNGEVKAGAKITTKSMTGFKVGPKAKVSEAIELALASTSGVDLEKLTQHVVYKVSGDSAEGYSWPSDIDENTVLVVIKTGATPDPEGTTDGQGSGSWTAYCVADGTTEELFKGEKTGIPVGNLGIQCWYFSLTKPTDGASAPNTAKIVEGTHYTVHVTDGTGKNHTLGFTAWASTPSDWGATAVAPSNG